MMAKWTEADEKQLNELLKRKADAESFMVERLTPFARIISADYAGVSVVDLRDILIEHRQQIVDALIDVGVKPSPKAEVREQHGAQ